MKKLLLVFCVFCVFKASAQFTDFKSAERYEPTAYNYIFHSTWYYSDGYWFCLLDFK